MVAASKYPCIYCLWEPRYSSEDKYTKTGWPPLPEWDDKIGPQNNAIKKPLVPRENMLYQPMHIKIGRKLLTQLLKQIVKTNNAAFLAIKTILPKFSYAKVNGGIYDEPEIWYLFANKDLVEWVSISVYF